MSSKVWLLFVTLAAGCAGATSGTENSVTPPSPTAEAEPEEVTVREPLPFGRNVNVKQYNRFVEVEISGIPFRDIELGKLASLLPRELRARYEGSIKAVEKLRPLARACHFVDGEEMDCEDECEDLETKRRAAFDELSSACSEQSDAAFEIEEVLRESLEGEEESAALAALALEYLKRAGSEADTICELNDNAAIFDDLTYGKLRQPREQRDRRRSESATRTLERAKELTKVDSEIGAVARYELARGYWEAGRPDDAREEYLELLENRAWEKTSGYLGSTEGLESELVLRIGFLYGTGEEPDYERSAVHLDRAREQVPSSDTKKQRDLQQMLLLARYRSHQFDAALKLATQLFTPNNSTVRRLAADSVERLGDDSLLDEVPEEIRAELLSTLAVRALYRRDLVETKALAQDSLGRIDRGPSAKRSLTTLKVAALIEGNETRAAQLDGELKALSTPRKGRSGKGLGIIGIQSLLAKNSSLGKIFGSAGLGFGTSGGTPRRKLGRFEKMSWESEERTKAFEADEDSSAAVRRVAALSRLCLEPDWWKVALVRDGNLRASLEISVYENDPAEVVVDWTPWEPVKSVSKCLTQMGTTYFSGAEESVRANVHLTEVARTAEQVRWREEEARLEMEMGDGVFGRQPR